MGRRRKSPSVTLATVRALQQVPTETLGRENDPTPERLARAGLSTAIQLGSGRIQVVNPPRNFVGFDGVLRLSQAPLDRLAARDQLDPGNVDRNNHLFQAGDKLRDHHHMAGLSGFAANDLNGSGGGHPSARTPITETMEKHRRAIRLAEGAMDRDAWIAVRAVVIEERTLVETGREFGYGKEHAASAVALDRLRRGLGALATLWGYLPPERPERAPPTPANDATATAAVSAA